MKFQKGQSGNPAGRPQGAKNKRTVYKELLEPHAPTLIQKAVTMAKDGDGAMLRLCIERLVPPLKSVDMAIALPAFEGSIAEQANSVLSQIASGELTPDQGSALIQSIGGLSRIIEVNELERRITELESKQLRRGAA